MPPHRLIGPSATATSLLLDAVVAVLAGTPAEAAAAHTRTTIEDLTDAVQAYHAAGTAALDVRAASVWYHARIQFPGSETAERMAATVVAPSLRQLQDDGIVAGWWFLRKHPWWRLRLRCGLPAADQADAIQAVLDDLLSTGVLARWQRGVYEPETAAFGGPPGIDTAHLLFCADSDEALKYLALRDPVIGRREISVLVCSVLLAAAGLDIFERGDVWHRVAVLRPEQEHISRSRIEPAADALRTLARAPLHPAAPPFSCGQPAAFAQSWAQAFHRAGRELKAAADEGLLSRGMRNVLAHIVIFHWNRLGISAASQAILARAAEQACLPPH